MEFFGLDIGSHKIKLVQLKKKADQYQLLAFGSASSTAKGLLSESESDLNSLAAVIKKLHREAKISTKNVVTALPQDRVFTRVITLPKLSEEELDSALKWEAEQYVPFPLDEMTLAHQIIRQLDQKGEEKIEVLLVAAPKRLIEKLNRVLKVAGLVPLSLEIEILAVARSLAPADPRPVLLAELGARATDLAIVENGQIAFVNSVPTAGQALTRALVQKFGLKRGQAEAYKKAYGADPQRLEGKVGEAISPLLDIITKEMEKTIQFYQQTQKKTIALVILTGGTAVLPEVSALLAEKLSLEVQLGDPFNRIIKDKLSEQVPVGEAPLYAAAAGLAMKKVG